MPLELPLVMGHRGAAAHAPENTLASIRTAAEQGATWVEFDTMLTGDRRPVLHHDDSLQRTTGRAAAMADTPFAELRKLDAGRWFASEFAGEAVPSLEQALELIWSLDLQANIEIKSTPGRDVETAEAALKIVAAHLPAGRPPPMISSFSRMSLAAARVLQPDWPRALIALRLPPDWQAALQALGCVSFHLHYRLIKPDLVTQVHDAGCRLAVYTVNDLRRARRLVKLGVDCLITDRPGKILDGLAAAKR